MICLLRAFTFPIIFMLAMSVSCDGLATPSGISKQQAAHIVVEYTKNYGDGFRGFLKDLQKNKHYPQLHASITSFLSNSPMDAQASNKIFRLVGIYSRIKYGEEAITTLARLVEIPTYEVEGQKQHDNPHIKKMGEVLGEISQEFGLVYRNVDNRVFEVTLPGSRGSNNGTGEDASHLIGLHAHVDTVPANKNNWVLKDGTQLDPYKLTRMSNRLYGRGTEDNKNGVVVALYAMKLIKEENIPLRQTFRLLIDTTEETTVEGVHYYLKHNVEPLYNLALDGNYPVVIAEKGYAVIMAKLPVRKGIGQGAEIISLTGGLATSQIPAQSVAVINVEDFKTFKTRLDQLAKAYIAANGANFSIDSRLVEGSSSQLKLTLTGVSAHSAEPASGVNPVSRMLSFIAQVNDNMEIKQNHITDVAQYAAANWGLGFYGEKLGINFSNDFMGPLTASFTQVNLDDQTLQVAVNLRIPVGQTQETLENKLKTGINHWMKASNIAFEVDYDFQFSPMYRNPKGIWINTLLDVASENLNIEREFKSANGFTSAISLSNGVEFGLALITEKYTGHTANEFKSEEQFLLDLQIVTQTIMALGQLEALDEGI